MNPANGPIGMPQTRGAAMGGHGVAPQGPAAGQRAIGTMPQAGSPGMSFMPGYAQSLRGAPIGMPGGGGPAVAPFRGPGPPGGGIPRGFPPGAGGGPAAGSDILALLAKGASGATQTPGGMHGPLLQPHQLQQQQLHAQFLHGGGRAGFPEDTGGGGTANDRLMSALLMANGGGAGGGTGVSSGLLAGHGGGASRGGTLGLGVGIIPTNSADATAAAAAASVASPDGLGLLGLLGVIKMPDRDVSSLALGTDLTTLGLNLNAPDPLYSTFDFPWGDVPAAREPQFALPSCYKMPQPALKTGHLQRFDVQTLFYIFYSMPRDVLQAYAAQELHSREWRYHTDNKLWFRREAENGKPGVGAVQWVYWDVNAWEKRVFTGTVATLASGFLAEEDARVKVQS